MIKLLCWPTGSRIITSKFGPRGGKFHDGDDIAPLVPNKDGDPLYSVSNDGVVVASKTNNGGVSVGLGHYLIIQYIGFFVEYAHMMSLGIPVGTKVKAGQIVGYMGHTGHCISSIPGGTGTHLHFRIAEGVYNPSTSHKLDSSGRSEGSIDPEPFLLNIDHIKEEQTNDGLDIYNKLNDYLQTIPTSDYAKESSKKAVKKGLFVDGNTDGLIDNPKGFLNREQLAVILNRAGLLD